MVIRKAFLFRLEPDDMHQVLLHQFCGHVLFVWSKTLALQQHRLERQGPVHTQQQALKRLDQALWERLDWNNLKGFPTFRKHRVHDSLRCPDLKQIKLDGAVWDEAGRRRLLKIFLPKLSITALNLRCQAP